MNGRDQTWARLFGGAGKQDDGLSALYRDHFAELVANIRKSFGSGPPEPEDVVQSAFAKYAALKSRTKIKDPRAFIYVAARNLVLDHKRSAKVVNAYIAEQIAFDRELTLEEITPERVLVSRERFNVLVEAMRALPHKQQVVLAMSRLEGKSYREIGEETGWSAGDISRNMTAAISALVIALKRTHVRKPRAADTTSNGTS